MATERQVERALVRVRQICTALPEVTERLSHGAPSFFVRSLALPGQADRPYHHDRIHLAYGELLRRAQRRVDALA